MIQNWCLHQELVDCSGEWAIPSGRMAGSENLQDWELITTWRTMNVMWEMEGITMDDSWLIC